VEPAKHLEDSLIEVDQLAHSMGDMNPMLLERRGTLGYAFSEDVPDRDRDLQNVA